MRAYLCHAPMEPILAMSLPDFDFAEMLTGEFYRLDAFVTRQEPTRGSLAELRGRVRPGGTLWCSWSKGRKCGTDLPVKSGIAIGYDANLVGNPCLRIDET